MASTVTQETSAINQGSSQFKRLAWLIMLVSFIMFCSLCIASTGVIYYYLFRSTLPMQVTVQVGRGSVALSAAYDERSLSNGDLPTVLNRTSVITTDALSQTALTFQVSLNDGDNPLATLGTLTLNTNSTITYNSARQPRFDWSNGYYAINLSDFSGSAELFLTQAPEHPFLMRIRTSSGNATFVFETIGRYSISANANSIYLKTDQGRGLLMSPDNNNNRLAISGEQVELLTGSNVPVVNQSAVNLLENGLFSFNIPINVENGERLLPLGWGCFNSADGLPTGQYYADTWQGRTVLRFIREVGDTTSQTGCQQSLNRSVSDYSYLELQATVAINLQSLTNCGNLGSECPIMLLINYIDQDGNDGLWYQGLFSNADPQRPDPLTCQRCGVTYPHTQIAEQVWFTYKSGNLFSRLSSPPVQITSVKVYASGHRYDVFISELALLAGIEQATVPVPQASQDR